MFIFGVCFVLYLMKLSAGKGFCISVFVVSLNPGWKVRKGVLFTKYCAHNICVLERFCPPSSYIREKISGLHSPYILVCARKIINVHERSSMRTKIFNL